MKSENIPIDLYRPREKYQIDDVSLIFPDPRRERKLKRETTAGAFSFFLFFTASSYERPPGELLGCQIHDTFPRDCGSFEVLESSEIYI